MGIELPTSAPAGPRSRLSPEWFHVLAQVWQLDRLRSRIRRQATTALLRAGEVMAQGSPSNLDDRARTLFQVAQEKLRLLKMRKEAKESSLSVDQNDYAVASRWARPLVIVRGLAARAVLRDQIRKGRRELRSAYLNLATYAFDDDIQPLRASVPDALANQVIAMRAEAARAMLKRDALVAPFGGRALPRLSHWIAREIALFASITATELKNRFLLRLPAFAGLVVGWWIPRTFSQSRSPGILRLLGIGQTGKRYLPPDTFRRLSFWLPVLASIVCAYLASRLGAFIRKRYAPAPAPTNPSARLPPGSQHL